MSLKHPLATLAAALTLATLAAAPAQAQSRCDKPVLSYEVRACAVARQGIGELRRYVQRTRKLYQLDLHDFAAVGSELRAAAAPEAIATDANASPSS